MTNEAKPDKQAVDEHDRGERKIERIERDPGGHVLVYLKGRSEPVVDARIARCFPWSVPDIFISIRDKDGKEIVLLETLDELHGATRRIVEEELRDKIFNPKIHRILSYKDEFGITSIRAETDRGETTFQIRSRDDVRVLSLTRALFRDVDGNTYELADLEALDPASRKHIMHYF